MINSEAIKIYHRFIKEESPVTITIVTDEQRENIIQTLEAASLQRSLNPPNTNGPQSITKDLYAVVFDDVWQDLEECLADQLFVPFFRSEYFTRFKKACYQGRNAV